MTGFSWRWAEISPLFFSILFFISEVQAGGPVVKNVRASQRGDESRLVDIYYDLEDSDTEHVLVTVKISDNGGASYDLIPVTLQGDFGLVGPGLNRHIVWDSGRDLPGVYGKHYRAAVTAEDAYTPEDALVTIAIPGLPPGSKPLELIGVPSGTFLMGSFHADPNRPANEKPEHHVTIAKSFFMGRCEVTNAQFRAFRSQHTSGDYEGNSLDGDNQPAALVSWSEAAAFCDWLTEETGMRFRLPTEAEWEYASRAGTTSYRFWEEMAPDASACEYANVLDLTAQNDSITSPLMFPCEDGYVVSAPVGSFLPNAFGLHDMLGNVWEWCLDWYEDYTSDSQIDPVGEGDLLYHVRRGGSWADGSDYIHTATRIPSAVGFQRYNVGFRVVMTPHE